MIFSPDSFTVASNVEFVDPEFTCSFSCVVETGDNPSNAPRIPFTSPKISIKLSLAVSISLNVSLNFSFAKSDKTPKSIFSSPSGLSKDLGDDLSVDCPVPVSCVNCSLSTPILSL